jgi:hypothetical protein
MPDFRKMSDDELEKYINENPLSHDIHGAIFEHDRRTAQHHAKIGGSRHNQILRWTTVGAIAAIIAAIAGVLMLLLR